ncbi:MAG: glycosyltransferase family A protein [Pseudomonadota bacterium]
MPNSTTFISIVIPTFRRPHFVGPLIEALQAQVHESRQLSGKVEILVVDNCPELSAKNAFEKIEDDLQGNFIATRYLSEPRLGVAHARNHGVVHARGQYILFIDDDETPASGWLSAFTKAAYDDVDAAFGRIEPNFASSPPSEISEALKVMFSRQLSAPSGANITSHRAWLGTGNSMFRRESLTATTPLFDTRFNGGGEDVELLRRLAAQGMSFTWCPGALVFEHVPSDRMTYEYVAARKFHDGQLRCVVEAEAKTLSASVTVATWMFVGLVQIITYSSLAVLLYPFDSGKFNTLCLKVHGGWGKLMWWRHPSRFA